MVASALADDYSVNVLVTGNVACTVRNKRDNSTVITIPAIDYDDPDYLTLVRGYIDHEAGHVRFTDFDCGEAAKTTYREVAERVHVLANIFEDAYVERKLSDYYTGCKSNFRRLSLRIFGNKDKYEGYDTESGFSLVTGYILYKVRSQVYPELAEGCDFIRKCMDRTYPGLADELDTQVLDGVLAKTISTQANIDLAVQVSSIIDKYIQEQQNNLAQQHTASNSSSSGSSTSNAGSKGGNDSTAGNDASGSKGSGTDNNASGSKGSGTGNDASSSKGSFGSGTGRNTGSSSGGAAENDLLKLMPDVNDLDEMGNVSVSRIISDQINHDLNDAHNLPPGGHQAMIVADSYGNVLSASQRATRMLLSTSTLKPDLYNNAVRVSCALDAQLQALLQTFVQNRGGAARIGKLDTRKLSRLAVNNPNVFNRYVDKQGISTDVIILMDASGSMNSGGRIETASSALYAVMRSLRKIKGVRSSAYAFGGDEVLRVVSPEERLTTNVFIHPNGGTFCGEALMAVATNFSTQPYNRRMVILMTDGETSNASYFTHTLNRFAKAGVIILGVGIQCSALRKHINNKDKYAEVYKLPDLVPELFRLLRKNLVEKSL